MGLVVSSDPVPHFPTGSPMICSAVRPTRETGSPFPGTCSPVLMRPPARPGNGVDAFDALRSHPEQPIVRDRNQLVLARAGPDCPRNVDIGGVDHGASKLEEFDLVGGLGGINFNRCSVRGRSLSQLGHDIG